MGTGVAVGERDLKNAITALADAGNFCVGGNGEFVIFCEFIEINQVILTRRFVLGIYEWKIRNFQILIGGEKSHEGGVLRDVMTNGSLFEDAKGNPRTGEGFGDGDAGGAAADDDTIENLIRHDGVLSLKMVGEFHREGCNFLAGRGWERGKEEITPALLLNGEPRPCIFPFLIQL